MQQYLPFTVLKLLTFFNSNIFVLLVATVLTVYGIETDNMTNNTWRNNQVATVLTVYGIETAIENHLNLDANLGCNSTYRLRY